MNYHKTLVVCAVGFIGFACSNWTSPMLSSSKPVHVDIRFVDRASDQLVKADQVWFVPTSPRGVLVNGRGGKFDDVDFKRIDYGAQQGAVKIELDVPSNARMDQVTKSVSTIVSCMTSNPTIRQVLVLVVDLEYEDQ